MLWIMFVLGSGNICSVWLVTIPGQTGNCKAGKTMEQIYKKTHLNQSCKGTAES